MNLKFILNKRLNVSYVINSGRKHPVSCKHKESKRNCKFFSDIGFFSIITKNANLNFLKTSLLSLLKVDIPV